VLLDAGYRCALFDGLNRFYAQADDTEALDVLSAPANVLDDFQPYNWMIRVEGLETELVRSIDYASNLERRVTELEGIDAHISSLPTVSELVAGLEQLVLRPKADGSDMDAEVNAPVVARLARVRDELRSLTQAVQRLGNEARSMLDRLA
jgi:hypothetical protein